MQKASNDLKNFIFTITVNKRSVYKEQYNFISQTNDRQQRLIENLKEMMSMQLLVLGLFLTSLPLIKCKNNTIKHHACSLIQPHSFITSFHCFMLLRQPQQQIH